MSGNEQEGQPNKEVQRLYQNTIAAVDRDLLWAADEYGIWEAIGDKGVASGGLLKGQEEELSYIRGKVSIIRHLLSRGFVQLDEEAILKIGSQYPDLLPGADFRRYILGLKEWYRLPYTAPRYLEQGIPAPLPQSEYDEIVEISEGLATKLPGPVREDFPALATEVMEALDIGSGKLFLLRTMAQENPHIRITAIEQNPKYLQFLAETLPEEGIADRVTIIEGKAQTSTHTLEDQRFGFILASHLIHWLTPDETHNLFSEARRLLRPGGAFFVYEDYLNTNGLEPEDSVGKHTRMVALGYQIFTDDQTLKMLRQAGFPDPRLRMIDSRRVLYECFP